MAGSRKYNKYYIIDEDVLKSGLKGNELLVYALVRSYVTAGIPFDLTVSKIMERTNIGRRQTIYVLQRLVEKGILVKLGQEKEGVTSCVYELGGAETAPVRKLHPCGNCTGTGAETAPERCGNCTGTGAETAPPSYNNNECNTVGNTFNNTYSNNNSLSTREENENKEKTIGGVVTCTVGSAKEKERLEMDVMVGIMKGWKRHYKDVYGEEYLIIRGSMVPEVSDLVPVIEQLMEHRGIDLTQESVMEYCFDLFTELKKTADSWQQQRWSLKLITRQFNQLLKQRNHGKSDATKNQSDERPRQIADASQFVDRL